MIPNEMVQPHTKRHQENRKDLAPRKQERSGTELKKKDCRNMKEN